MNILLMCAEVGMQQCVRVLPVAYLFERTGPAARCPSRQCSPTTVPRWCRWASSDFIHTFRCILLTLVAFVVSCALSGPSLSRHPSARKHRNAKKACEGEQIFWQLEDLREFWRMCFGANLHLVRQGV